MAKPEFITKTERLSDIVKSVEAGRLIPQPAFQRRMVWTSAVKEEFLLTIRDHLPFPEIFIAASPVDPDTLDRVNLLVDGQQRVRTIIQYVRADPRLVLKNTPSFALLSPQEKKDFYDYPIAVRDLGVVTTDQVKEVFRRINSTDYSLNATERLNALYGGKFKEFCEDLTHHVFFESRRVFTAADFRRMRDISFCVTLVATLLSQYFRRQEDHERFLRDYDEDFPHAIMVTSGLDATFAFVETCAFSEDCRCWKKTDLLTLLVEVYRRIAGKRLQPSPSAVGQKLGYFYEQVAGFAKDPKTVLPKDVGADVREYQKFASKASDDGYARAERGRIIGAIIDATIQIESPPRPKKPRGRKASGESHS